MTDEMMLEFIVQMTARATDLHAGHKHSTPAEPERPAARSMYDAKTISIDEEGFSRWMGWRGQEAQQLEIEDWPYRSFGGSRTKKDLLQENGQLWNVLEELRNLIQQVLKDREHLKGK